MRRVLSLAWSAVLLELAIYRALVRWVLRRYDVPRGARAIGYSRLVTPMLWLWIFGSAVEVVVADVVLRHVDQPWAAGLRLPVLALGIWGLLWMLGMLAANRVRPHVVTGTELVLRSGPRTWVVVPLEAVAAARPVEHELPGVIRTLHVDGDLVLVGVSRRTNVELTLASPTVLRTSQGEVAARRVGAWVDEPRTVAAEIGASSRATSDAGP